LIILRFTKRFSAVENQNNCINLRLLRGHCYIVFRVIAR